MDKKRQGELLRLGGITWRQVHTQCAIQHWRNSSYMVDTGHHTESLSGTFWCARFCDNCQECPYERLQGCSAEAPQVTVKCLPCPCARPASQERLEAFFAWLEDQLARQRQHSRPRLDASNRERRRSNGSIMVPAL